MSKTTRMTLSGDRHRVEIPTRQDSKRDAAADRRQAKEQEIKLGRRR